MPGEEGGNAVARLETVKARIAARNGALNIVTAADFETAFVAAEESDRRFVTGDGLGPLDGLLVGVKDNIPVAGLPWTAGVGAYRDRIAHEDAPVVARLRAAGAIPFAMLNMHQGALGATTDNPHFGRTANPLDPARTPGGSSGGSGAAVAAGFADAALGTDTMGSVRIPAAYCGTIGLKPTHGLVPRSGITHLSPTFDTIGPLAPDLASIAAMLDAMAFVDTGDPQSRPAPTESAPPDRKTDISGIRIGVPSQVDAVDCEAEVLAGLSKARDAFTAMGAAVVDIEMVGWNPGRAYRGGLLVVEAEGAVEFADILDRAGDDTMSLELRNLLSYGRNLSSARLVEGFARVRAAAAAADRALAECDALLMPTVPQRPFLSSDDVPVNQAEFTALANFHGGAALALPVAMPGLPVSVQLLGRPFSESLLLDLGCALLDALPA